MNPQDPFYKDIDSLPPYIDYQIASIIIQRILSPLRKDVLRILQTTFNTHSPKDWFATFLASFILLQNYEMQVLFQRQFAERRRARVRRQSISQISPPPVLTFPNCRCNTWTCRSCGRATRAPKPSWRTSTTATRASGSSRRASTGRPRACAGWRAWTRSRAPSWRSAGMWWCRRVSLLPPLAPRWQCNTGWDPVLTKLQHRLSKESTARTCTTTNGGTPPSSSTRTGPRATPSSTPRRPSPSLSPEGTGMKERGEGSKKCGLIFFFRGAAPPAPRLEPLTPAQRPVETPAVGSDY